LKFWYIINIAAKCIENKKSSNFLLVFQGLVKASGVNIRSCGCVNHEWILNLLYLRWKSGQCVFWIPCD
jgi:hypothetical protein